MIFKNNIIFWKKCVKRESFIYYNSNAFVNNHYIKETENAVQLNFE